MKGIISMPDRVQAIMDGRKTVTRWLSGLKEINEHPGEWEYRGISTKGEFIFADSRRMILSFVKPRYHAGEMVYVKEAIEIHETVNDGILQGWLVIYPDNSTKMIWLKDVSLDFRPKPKYQKMFMPTWAARTFLRILDIRPERLQEITEDDCLREGLIKSKCMLWEVGKIPGMASNVGYITGLLAYETLWDSINQKYPWDSNPWVWRIEFKLVVPVDPIDFMDDKLGQALAEKRSKEILAF